jgi:hypothetical protein
MSLLEVNIHPTGQPVSGPETALALNLRARISAKHEELWTI